MSVILDALKRVQDENRRRGVEAESPQPPVAHGGSRLMRRLSASADASQQENDGTLPPVAAVGLLVVVLVGIVAGALWWFEPTFAGPAANNGRPLLSELSTPQRQAAMARNSAAARPAAVPAGAITEPFSPVRGESEIADATPATVSSDDALNNSAPASVTSGLSDLSGRLPAADERGDSNGVLRLETSRATGAASGQSGYLDLSTDRGATAQGSAAAPSPRDGTFPGERGRRPSRLVDPGVKTAFQAGVQAQKTGDYPRAEDAYKRALKFDPDNARVNANLGVLYEQLDRLTRAENHLRRAIAIEPGNPGFHNNLGVVLYRFGNFDSAMLEFKRTLTIDPQRLDAYTNQGLIYTRWGQYDRAAAVFRQALQIDPENALAHYNLGLVCEETEQFQCALDNYYEFLTLGGSDNPRITEYLSDHLMWLEARVGQSGDGARRDRP